MTRGTSDPDSTFSQGFPLTPIDDANDIGQIYHGPVILVTDALCYSATDLSAADMWIPEDDLLLLKYVTNK